MTAPQLLANSILQASGICLVGVGFAVIYRTGRFLHFAHGLVFASGAYFVLALKVYLSLPLLPSVALAVCLSALLGCGIEVLVYRPLRRRRAAPLILLLASFGVYVVLQNVVSLAFGDGVRSIRSGGTTEGVQIMGARLTPVQLLTVAAAIVLTTGVWLLLKLTKFGRLARAVGSAPELAAASGIEIDRVLLWAFALGSALAGVAGILLGLDVDLAPTMGMGPLMMGMVAVIIAGTSNVGGIALGALLLGLAQNFGVWRIGSEWRDTVVFVVLLVFLILRPGGFLTRGTARRKTWA